MTTPSNNKKAKEKPNLVSTTQANKQTPTECEVTTKRKVTYIFFITSKTSLNLPYAIAVNGKTLPEYAKKNARVSGNYGKITVWVEQDDKVALYLNSDAHPDYRTEPVYEITAGERDVEITITEKPGKNADTDEPVRVKDKDDEIEAKKAADTYVATLTGDIWMKVSHKYSSDEIDALIPKDTSEVVKAALKSIYDGLKTKKLNIPIPDKIDKKKNASADEKQNDPTGEENTNINTKRKPDTKTSEKPSKTNILAVHFTDANNPLNNIQHFDLLADGLPRVHPAGYAALFSAALEAELTDITMSSVWRPMEGSIAHRAGLGLDVNYVEKIHLNRQELLNKNAEHAGNVSDEEKKLYKAFKEAEAEEKKADHAKVDAEKKFDAIKKIKLKTPATEADQKKHEDAQKAAEELKKKTDNELKEAAKKRKDKNDEWIAELEKNLPPKVKVFRQALLQSPRIKELFDPWYMDYNTRDDVAAKPNRQVEENEKLHATHIHITVIEQQIL